MTMIAFDLPEGAFAALRKDPQEMQAELRMAAAAKWYELGLISQERGAEVAGLPRLEFMRALGRFGVSPFQEDLDADGRTDDDSLVMGESEVTFEEQPSKNEVTND